MNMPEIIAEHLKQFAGHRKDVGAPDYLVYRRRDVSPVHWVLIKFEEPGKIGLVSGTDWGTAANDTVFITDPDFLDKITNFMNRHLR